MNGGGSGSGGHDGGMNGGGSGSGGHDGGMGGDGSGSGGHDGGMGGDGSGAGGYVNAGGNGTGGRTVAGAGTGGGGTMTAAEQVAILDERLDRGTDEFDDLIVRERGIIRRTAKSGPGTGERASGQAPEAYGAGAGVGDGPAYRVPPMAGGGGGRGGAMPREVYDADIPQQTAVYAPPADIPDGNDDDVVARQLREAAMREPDPALREKLWDEYRKYKGIE